MEIILYDDVLPKLVCFSLSNFVYSPVYSPALGDESSL